MTIFYVTGNKNKYENARKFFESYNITVEQLPLKINEIQDGDSLQVAIAKARDAFAIVKKPIFVNDTSWIIPSLNGFPGPFMKYINEWFQPEDFIHLMDGKKDRSIILRDIIIYIDEAGYTVFTNDHTGKLLKIPANLPYKHPSDVVVSLSNNGASIAEESIRGNSFIEGEKKIWCEFADWLNKKGGR